MARPLRLEAKNTFYHILNRGVDRRPIFEDDGDYEKFLEFMGVLSERYRIGIWSYVLMGNHYHWVVKTREENLSTAMQWFGLNYAGYYNWRHRRSGHLFQGRFKSFIVEDGKYLERLTLYIHKNPLRANIVERLADYPWSSYLCLAYGKKCQAWVEREKVLNLFGGEQAGFRRAVKSYSEEKDRLLEDLRHGFFLGAEKALKTLTKRFRIKEEREQPQTRQIRRERDLSSLMVGFRRRLGLSAQELESIRHPSRGVERPLRDILIYLAWKEGIFSLAAIGEYFHVGYTAVANARKRAEQVISKNRNLRRMVEKIEDG